MDGPLFFGREWHTVVIRDRNGALQGLAATCVVTRIKQQVTGHSTGPARFHNVPLCVHQLYVFTCDSLMALSCGINALTFIHCSLS